VVDGRKTETREVAVIERNIFDELFVLEVANNHWGSLERGLRIIREFSTIARYHNMRCAMKLQFRDVEHFIHKDFRDRQDIRYVKKTVDTKMSDEEYGALVEESRRNNCIRMATPFDERSVDLCVELGIEIIKIASSDITDWTLLEKIAKTRKPVIASTGGASVKDMDAMVTFFGNRSIPIAINHCVSLYPSEGEELELNQIDFLKRRYPTHTIGWSGHERSADIHDTMLAAYAKGARTFERHIDIVTPDKTFSPYCSTPEEVSDWFSAFNRAKALCGGSGDTRRTLPRREIEYLDALVRGVYAKRDMPAGARITRDDYYLAVPLQKGQLSSRELIDGDLLVNPVAKDAPIRIELFDNPYSRTPELRKVIEGRGL
jgi:sialic acid synthase SpsE